MSHYEKRELLRLARNGHIRRLRVLLDDGVDVNFLDHKTGMTPLMTAAYAGHANVVKMLLGSGASPNLIAEDGASALHWAARNGYFEIVNMLLVANADANVRRSTDRGDDDGPTPLHMAIGNGHDLIAIALIKAGASLDIEYFGRDIKEYAEWHKRDGIVKFVRERSHRRATMPN